MFRGGNIFTILTDKFFFSGVISLILLSQAFPHKALANDDLPQPTRTMLIAGDSWVYLPCVFGSFHQMAEYHYGSDVQILHCRKTSRVGMRAEQWATSIEHQQVLSDLAQDALKKIKVIYLSLGGNDFINYWNNHLNSEQEALVFEKIKSQVLAIVQQYKSVRPDVAVIVTGYDFPRFTDDNQVQKYREVLSDFGSPLPNILNNAIIRLSNKMAELNEEKQNIYYIQHYGLLHYYYGITKANVSALQTLSPDQISPLNNPTAIGGDINYQGDSTGYASWLGIRDAFHLNHFGYRKLAEHVFNNRLRYILPSN